MNADQIFPGIDYAFRIADGSAPVRCQVSDVTSDGIVTGRFIQPPSVVGGPPITGLSLARFVDTWSSYEAKASTKVSQPSHIADRPVLVGLLIGIPIGAAIQAALSVAFILLNP